MPESSPLVSRASTRAQAAEHVQHSKPKRALGPTRMGPEKMPIPQLADILARNVARPVIDQTGLTGRYLITLAWQRDDMPSAPNPDGPELPSIFFALQEQLGLKLEAKNGSVEMLVIDHIDKKPVEN